MAANLGTLTLDVVAKIGGFTGPLDEAGRASKKYAASVKKASEDAGKSAGKLGAAIGAGAAAAAIGLGVLVSQQLEVIGDQDDLAKRLRTTVDSLGVLQRAGELSGVSMDQISAAATKLELAMGKAASGSKAQVEAFDRLGISYQDLAKLPLDERILAVNKALEESVPDYERAAVAATLFGAKNGAALQQLDPETLAEANRQITVFGVKLSDIDSSKVEAAGDAISIFSLAADGLAKQLTVELSPLLTQLSTDFLDAAESAGGVGPAVRDSVKTALESVAFLINAGDGVGRVFKIISAEFDGLVSSAAGSIIAGVYQTLTLLNKLPGVDLSEQLGGLESNYNAQVEAALDATERMRDALESPLAGDAFVEYYEKAQKAAEDAALANQQETKTKKDRIVAGEQYSASLKAQEAAEKAAAAEAKKLAAAREQQLKAINDQIAGFELEAATVGMTATQQKLYKLALDGATESQIKQATAALDAVSAFEAQKKSQEDYKALISDLRTDEEQLTDQLKQRLAVLDSISNITDEERNKSLGRIADQATEDAPDFQGPSPENGGFLSEFTKLDDAEQELEDWYSKQLTMLDQFRAERSDLSETWDAQELELKKQHEEQMGKIEQARQQVGLNSLGDFFGQVANLRNNDSKKGKALGKAAAIAQATINAYTAATGAYASASAIPVVGWVLGPVAAAAALAAGLANVSAIKGQAHDGIMSVPSSGTWNLEKGERVTTANTSAALDATLADIQRGQRNGGTGDTNINISLPQMNSRRETQEAAAITARRVSNAVSNAARYQ